MSEQQLRQHIEEQYKQELAEYKKMIQQQQHTCKHNHEVDENLGCLALLRKLTCSLQCGGTSCSIKETEQTSRSTTPSVSSLGSIDLEQHDPMQRSPSEPPSQVEQQPPLASKSRKRPQKKKSNVSVPQEVTMDPPAPAVKKARRPSKKKQVPDLKDQ